MKPTFWILHSTVVGAVPGPLPHVCCAPPRRCLVVDQQGLPPELPPLPRSTPPSRPPFFPQTAAYTWPPAFPPPLAPGLWSWPHNPLSPDRIGSLPPLLFPHVHDSICISLSFQCTVTKVARSHHQQVRPLRSAGQPQREQVAIIWHAQRFPGRKAWKKFPCKGRTIRIQHTDLGTYNTLAGDMVEVGTPVTLFGDCHPYGQLCGRKEHYKYLRHAQHLIVLTYPC